MNPSEDDTLEGDSSPGEGPEPQRASRAGEPPPAGQRKNAAKTLRTKRGLKVALDWRSMLVIAGLILVLTAKWWLGPLLNINFKAVWADKNYALVIIPTDELSRSRYSLLSYHVAVVNHSRVTSDEDVKEFTSALQTQIHRDLAPAWGIDAELKFVSGSESPPPNWWWLEVLDSERVPAEVSYHDLTPEGLPRARVFPQTAARLGISWTLSGSHELLELLVDPRMNLAAKNYTGDGRDQVYEYQICDPVSSKKNSYSIGKTMVSDFVYPVWFDASIKPGGARFDYEQEVSEPFQILPDGYATTLTGGAWQQIRK